jgi:hypothetical protein
LSPFEPFFRSRTAVEVSALVLSADTSFPAGRIQTRLRSFPQHGEFEPTNAPTICNLLPAGV